MAALRQLTFFGVAAALAGQALFAQPLNPEKLSVQIGQLTWDKDDIEASSSSNPKAQIVVVAHYCNPQVMDDCDTNYIHLYVPKRIVNKDESISFELSGESMDGKCRDGMDRWCNGCGNFENISKRGFDYHLNLDWQIDKEEKKSFDQTFHCQWTKHQIFHRKGFTIIITTSLKN